MPVTSAPARIRPASQPLLTPPNSQKWIRSAAICTTRSPQAIIQEEIGAQTWQVPANLITLLLSPKRLQDNYRSKKEINQPLDCYDIFIEEPYLPPLPPSPPCPNFSSSDRENYNSISSFLTQAFSLCEKARKTAVEVKDDWPDLCRQAATYARAMFAAVPLRSFSLVIGINHAKCELRFLIFHSGGLTSHSPLSFTREADRQIILRVMFALSLWQTPEHAGLPCFTDGFSIVLASSRIGDPPIVIRIQERPYHAVVVRGRNTVVYLLQLDTSAPAGKDLTWSYQA